MIACVIGGVLGGLTLVRPGAVLGLTALDEEAGDGDDQASPAASARIAGRTEGRALGGLLILSHATAALF
ncbi:MAG: DUF4345 domain-containing protein, partial [Caulobacter sp.]|nr:DUF4345 domain-containing protein [Caulobacter sp.]